MIEVNLLAHSVNVANEEAITWALCYERMIHGEFMAHRTSRNASSSRAIPQEVMNQWIITNPALPLHLGRKRKGMKASPQEVKNPDRVLQLIGRHRRYSLAITRALDREGCHKEVSNRYSEAHGHINVVMTSGRAQLMNFFSLRIVPGGDVNANFERLAVRMARLYRQSTPRLLYPGEWHLPYVGEEQRTAWCLDDQIRRSAAACGWTSYQTVDGRDSTQEDEKDMHDRLVDKNHVSPLEHQLEAMPDHGRYGGLVPGYRQYRHTIPGESVADFDFSILDQFPD